MAKTRSRKKTGARRTRKGTRARSGGRKASAEPTPGVCPLTGLPLGPAAQAPWEAEVARSLETGRPCALALIDVDGFSRHTDDLGTERADLLLTQIAERLAAALADEAGAAKLHVGRLAGDLFGCVLPDTEVEDALAIAEAARAKTLKKPFKVGRGVKARAVEPTLSGGVAGLHRDARDYPSLLGLARDALWRAKSLGGNRVGLPAKERMVLKSSYYPQSQLDRLKRLALRLGVKESVLLREALGDLFLEYKGRRPDG